MAKEEKLAALSERIAGEMASADVVVREIEEGVRELREQYVFAKTVNGAAGEQDAITNYFNSAFRLLENSRRLEHLAWNIQVFSYLHHAALDADR